MDPDEQLIRLVRSCPESALFRQAVRRVSEPRVLRWAAKEMFRHASSSNDLRVTLNAVRVILYFDDERVIFLLRRSLAVNPSSFAIRAELAHAYLRLARHSLGERQTTSGTVAYYEFQAVLRSGRVSESLLLVHLAESALLADLLEDAEEWAERALSYAARNPFEWDAGDKFYDGHRILGHVALRRGDLARARELLKLSCTGRSSPVLGSFGPDMSLARELLNRGARADVVDFLIECQRIWPRGIGRLQGWIRQIRDGATPGLNQFAPQVGKQGN